MVDEMTDVILDNAGYVCPEQTDKIALIDADTIIFASCSVLSQTDELLPRHMYSDEEWEDIANSNGYDEESQTIKFINLDEAYAHSMDKIKSIMERTGCADFELHFTRGRESFPYTMVDAEYKGNRDFSAIPYGLGELKDLFVATHPDKAFNNYLAEADHIVVCKKRDNPEKYILCAVDKDVIYALEGTHFNYYSSTKYNIPMKWVTITEDDAMRRYYIQTLTGDTGDNVIGIHGIGPKKAEKILAKCTTPRECWDEVVATYIKNNRTEIEAITNFRLVDMRQLELVDGEYQVKLWDPRNL